MTKKYTVLVNYDEYAIGVYNSEAEAKDAMAGIIAREIHGTEGLSKTELVEEYGGDGYFRVLEIELA